MAQGSKMATVKDKATRVKVSRRLNESEHDHIRHTFLSAGGNAPPFDSHLANAPAEDKASKLTPFHHECFCNHGDDLVSAIKWHLDNMSNPEEINWQDAIGLSPLHLLCGFNGSIYFVEALELLLEKGANLKAIDLRGYTPFHYMCFNAMLSIEVQLKGLSMLIRRGSDINAKEYRVRASPLHLLCNYNTKKKLDPIISFFILHRASLHAKTSENRTALHCLCRTHRDEHLLGAVTILVRHGADANVRDDNNLTALHEVCLFYQKPNLSSVIDQLLSNKSTCVNYAAMHKRAALHLIAIHYHHANLPELLESMLTKHGADPNQSDEKYRTPLHYFLQYNRSSCWKEAIEVLIRSGADLERRDLKFGRPALHQACLNFYQATELPEIIELMIKNGANVNFLDKHNRSVLHYLTSASAVNLNVGRCVELILPHLNEHTVDEVSVQGTTALTQAARMGCVATLRQLIPKANKNVTDSFGKNVLEYLKELGERKGRPLCSCCQAVGSFVLPQALVMNLTSKERVRLRHPERFSLAELGRYVLDTSPYVTFLYEDHLFKLATPKWMEFLDFWNHSKTLSLNDIVRVQRFIRGMTHPCKLPPLIPPRRNKCGWCDTIGTVHSYVKTLTDKAGQMDYRFRPSSVIVYGSLAEGSKLFAPDSYHYAVVLADWYEDPLHPQTVRYNGDEALVEQFASRKKLGEISSSKLSQYYNGILETAASWIQRFEIFEHWTSSFDEINTTLYLVYRGKNNQAPMRLAVSLSLAIERAPGHTLRRSQLPSWCRVAERDEKMEYLGAKPSMEGWRSIYPAVERDSIRHSGSTALQVFQLVKLLIAASNSTEDGQIMKEDPSSFALKNSLLHYMELNPPPWNTVDIILHSQGVIDVILDKHDFSMSFFDDKEKITFDQMPLFSPIAFDIKKKIMLIKLQLKCLLNDRHHSFTI
ncbi:uncharacterized protein LOC130701038 [Daphnia carinata]|uniref:uncharacterized protein LOC130701038 n=1 Tax=Daphnia carinata TaxID=120202 RepID=UPI00257B3DC9|nr:uncharacterized protein LOC130701038 [Daphnia carinata]